MPSIATRPQGATFDHLPDSAHIRVQEVATLYGVSIDTIWRWARQRHIPLPVKLGPNTTGWNVGELRRALQSAA